MNRRGFLVGGHWIVDRLKQVDLYPREEGLAVISEESRAGGGGAFNVAKDLSRMNVGLPVDGIGLLGDDEDGRWTLEECRTHGVGTEQIKRLSGVPTSYTDVFTVSGTGKRTFFTSKGACAKLGEKDFDFTVSNAKVFYLAYLGMLDGLDAKCPREQLPQSAKVLRRAGGAGMLTAVDLVSIGDDFALAVEPCLPLVDYFFANDFEAEKLTGVAIGGKSGASLASALEEAARKIVAKGVRKACILHVPAGAVAVTPDGKAIKQGSVQVDPSKIKGSTGCGDAFAAGVLYGVHEQFDLLAALELGVSVAARCLLSASSSESITDWKVCLSEARQQGFRKDF
ncbi:MAG: carbohydrate kinase family protein [Verrucomicrobiales bacterium]|jgi:sugar/nucleoside kinase (ribokinase family)|nr:carbohydrate kinase family protein [Verrucomicrobiales bacterium]